MSSSLPTSLGFFSYYSSQWPSCPWKNAKLLSFLLTLHQGYYPQSLHRWILLWSFRSQLKFCLLLVRLSQISPPIIKQLPQTHSIISSCHFSLSEITLIMCLLLACYLFLLFQDMTCMRVRAFTLMYIALSLGYEQCLAI